MPDRLAPILFPLDPKIRYVAANQAGRISEMEQRPEWPSHNPQDTDRMEELFVNPIVLEATRRRGDLDLDGVRFVVIRYGKQYQVILPFRAGHVSVGVEASADVVEVAGKVAQALATLEKARSRDRPKTRRRRNL